MNKNYSHIITDDLNIITNENLWLSISKEPNYQKQKQTNFKDAYEIMQTGIGKVTEKISNGKEIHNKQSIFRMERSCCALSKRKHSHPEKHVDRKNFHWMKLHEIKSTIISLKKDFLIVPIDMAANNSAFIWKHFYA